MDNWGQFLSETDILFLEKLYKSEYKKLYNYASSVFFSCHSNYIEDVIQDTFVIATKKIDSLRKNDSPQRWIFYTLKNVMRNRIRSLKRLNDNTVEYVEETTSVPDTIDPQNNLRLQYDGILEKDALDLLFAHYVDGFPLAILASKQGISLSACKMKIFRAKKELRKKLEKY